MGSIRFPSIGHSEKFGYLIHSSYYDRNHNWRTNGAGWIAPFATYYETYGDGNVQHSPDIAIPVSMFSDWCASLASFLIDPANQDALEIVVSHWPARYNDCMLRDRIVNAAKIRHNPEKRQWFNLDTLAVSKADSKRHDKRWEEVPPYADGSIGAVFGLLRAKHNASPSSLDIYVIFDHLTHVLEEITGDSYYHVGVYRKEFCEDGDHWDVASAFGALKAIVDSAISRNSAERLLTSYRHNLENRKEKLAEQSA